MANMIPNEKGNAKPQGTGGEKMRGKDPHASGRHHQFNKHHGMNHAMGEVDGDGSDESTGSPDHESMYCDDGDCD